MDRMVNAVWLDLLAYPGHARVRERLRDLVAPGLVLLVPARAVNDILRAAFFPEMADLAGHTIADHAAITARLLGEPFTQVHAYIDGTAASLGPHHRAVLHDLVTSPGRVAEAFAQSPGGGVREAAAAIIGHYLPDSTTPDGVRLLGLRVHLADLVGAIALASLVWRTWKAAVQWRRALAVESLCRVGVEAFTAGDFDRAAEAFAAATFIDRDAAPLYFNLGHAKRLAGDEGAARAAYLRAAELFGSAEMPLGQLEASAGGIALYLAGIGADAGDHDRGLLAAAKLAFVRGCRRALGGGAWRRRLGERVEALAGQVSRLDPSFGRLVDGPARIYFPRRALGNAFLAALCDALVAGGNGRGPDYHRADRDGHRLGGQGGDKMGGRPGLDAGRALP